jgi:hypothetical protein
MNVLGQVTLSDKLISERHRNKRHDHETNDKKYVGDLLKPFQIDLLMFVVSDGCV